MIRHATNENDLRRCYPVMRQLRPHLTEDQYVERATRQEREGYRTAFLEEAADGRSEPIVRAVAGYRLMENLFSGPHMYVDDLVTDETERSHGHGEALLTWLIDFARSAGCKAFELDSGTHRIHAHRFYMRHRMIIGAFHFRMALDGANQNAGRPGGA